MKKNRFWSLIVIAVVVVIVGFLGTGMVACSGVKEYKLSQGKVYGTYYRIQYDWSEDVQDDIRRQLERVDGSLSMFNKRSTIARINSGEIDSTDVLFRAMYAVAKEVHQKTDGAFDITVAPLVNAWGFGVDNKRMPDSTKVDSILSFVGMDKVSLVEGRLIKSDTRIKLDASSIAKGFGIDIVAEYFDGLGVNNYLIDIGGEVRVKGVNTKGSKWKIGIEKPFDETSFEKRGVELVLAFSKGAIATSGNYRNYYVRGGQKYAHTINPKTGYTIQTEVLSASVYSDNCMLSDAYATAFMVMGYEKSRSLVEADSSLEACLIYLEDDKLKVWTSPGLPQSNK